MKYGRRDYPVDIIIRAWGNHDMTERCIVTITENTRQELYRLTIVEAPEKGRVISGPVLKTRPDGEWHQHVILPANMGAVRATNAGMSLAMLTPSDYIMVFDNDAYVPDGDDTWLDRLLSRMKDDNVGAVGCVSDRVSGYQRYDNVRKAMEGHDGNTFRVPWLVSFACLYRKDALKSMLNPEGPYWDERFEPGNSEDTDCSIRMAMQGYRNVVAGDVFINHDCSQTFRKLDFGELLKKNSEAMKDKWGSDMLEKFDCKVEH